MGEDGASTGGEEGATAAGHGRKEGASRQDSVIYYPEVYRRILTVCVGESHFVHELDFQGQDVR